MQQYDNDMIWSFKFSCPKLPLAYATSSPSAIDWYELGPTQHKAKTCTDLCIHCGISRLCLEADTMKITTLYKLDHWIKVIRSSWGSSGMYDLQAKQGFTIGVPVSAPMTKLPWLCEPRILSNSETIRETRGPYLSSNGQPTFKMKLECVIENNCEVESKMMY